MSEYKPKPFTKEVSDLMKLEMSKPFDEKRTLCNVLKVAHHCAERGSSNLEAVRSLLLEAFWIGQRMSAKLTKNKKKELDTEHSMQEEDEDPFGAGWNNLSQGNYD
jgi:hypothetical protein